jgi:hypothetical protein
LIPANLHFDQILDLRVAIWTNRLPNGIPNPKALLQQASFQKTIQKQEKNAPFTLPTDLNDLGSMHFEDQNRDPFVNDMVKTENPPPEALSQKQTTGGSGSYEDQSDPEAAVNEVAVHENLEQQLQDLGQAPGEVSA